MKLAQDSRREGGEDPIDPVYVDAPDLIGEQYECACPGGDVVDPQITCVSAAKMHGQYCASYSPGQGLAFATEHGYTEVLPAA